MMPELTTDSLYHALFTHFPGHVYWKNREGIYLGCNEQQARSLGLSSRSDIIGKTDADLPWNQDDAARMRENDLYVMQTGQPTIIEETAYFEGRPSPVLSQKIPLRNEQQHIIGLLGLSIDISERKKAEALLQEAKEYADKLSQRKSDFMAVASHELRIPLSGILGMMDCLANDALGQTKRKEYLMHLRHAGEHLDTLLHTILDFTQLESGQWALKPRPLDLRPLITETVSMLIPLAQTKSLDILIDYPNDLPRHIIADPRALRQLFAHLLSNAIQYTQKGHVRIGVQVSLSSWLFTIEDTGIGIPADQQQTIFEAFSQLASPYTRLSSRGGLGLGLAISQKLVESMKGKLSVTSEVNQGSTFVCELPLAYPNGVYLTGETSHDVIQENIPT